MDKNIIHECLNFIQIYFGEFSTDTIDHETAADNVQTIVKLMNDNPIIVIELDG